MQKVARVTPCAWAVARKGLCRNFSASSAAMAAKGPQDNVQRLYVEKIQEYSKLSASGKIKMDAQSEKDFKAESEKLNKMYGGGDLTKFPQFQFKEIDFTAKQDV